eukprot:GHUV01014841.1.p1 GENE.GHUV01014841.1~~GHUV01014841.1.p1  ORF type:complete len:133 (+),score=30.54 GHUV01014841.1:105-503(+)
MQCFRVPCHAAQQPVSINFKPQPPSVGPITARSLKDNVAALPPTDSIAAVTLQPINHTIQNAPGKKASVAIYSYLAFKYGGRLTIEAAEEGLQLYDEVVADAKAHPGSHPNIDILLDVIGNQTQLSIEVQQS